MEKASNPSKKIRIRYYIDREFQTNFMVRFALIILIVGGVALGLLWALEKNAYSLPFWPRGVLVSLDTSNPIPCQTGPLFKPSKYYNAFQLLWKPVLIISGINLAIILLFSLFYSHKMAGPVYNIKRSLRDLAQGGEPRPIKLRKGDQFQELADILNEVIEKRVK